MSWTDRVVPTYSIHFNCSAERCVSSFYIIHNGSWTIYDAYYGTSSFIVARIIFYETRKFSTSRSRKVTPIDHNRCYWHCEFENNDVRLRVTTKPCRRSSQPQTRDRVVRKGSGVVADRSVRTINLSTRPSVAIVWTAEDRTRTTSDESHRSVVRYYARKPADQSACRRVYRSPSAFVRIRVYAALCCDHWSLTVTDESKDLTTPPRRLYVDPRPNTAGHSYIMLFSPQRRRVWYGSEPTDSFVR